MLLWGIRDQTIDVDMRLDPEPAGIFESIARVKMDLDLNIELASPADFLPVPSDWRERSVLIEKFGDIEFFHYDPRMQCLAKLERGHQQDLGDCGAMLERGWVQADELRETLARIRPALLRFPAIEADEFESKVAKFLSEYEKRACRPE